MNKYLIRIYAPSGIHREIATFTNFGDANRAAFDDCPGLDILDKAADLFNPDQHYQEIITEVWSIGRAWRDVPPVNVARYRINRGGLAVPLPLT